LRIADGARKATLTTGLALWVLYGASQGDWAIIAANGLGATLAATVLVCKIRDLGCQDRAN
jgi:MtN3 and saliva related transmembrane protein